MAKQSNKRLADRLRAEFPTSFLEGSPELTQLLIDAACALENGRGKAFYVVGFYLGRYIRGDSWTRHIGAATRYNTLSEARKAAADSKWTYKGFNDGFAIAFKMTPDLSCTKSFDVSPTAENRGRVS